MTAYNRNSLNFDSRKPFWIINLEKKNRLDYLQRFLKKNFNPKTCPVPISASDSNFEQIFDYSKLTYKKDFVENRTLIPRLAFVSLKFIFNGVMGLFGVPLEGVCIGLTENEAFVQSSSGLLGVYGMFKIILNRRQRRLFIEEIDMLSPDYFSFLQKMHARVLSNSAYLFATSFFFFLFSIIFYSRIRKSASAWKRFFNTYVLGHVEKNVIHYQKKLYCEKCGRVPADVMFRKCGHLVYCFECFKSIESVEIDEANLKCSEVACLDCGAKNTEFLKIIYS